jgi:hypothetical protein
MGLIVRSGSSQQDWSATLSSSGRFFFSDGKISPIVRFPRLCDAAVKFQLFCNKLLPGGFSDERFQRDTVSPDFFVQHTKTGENVPNNHKIFQMDIK